MDFLIRYGRSAYLGRFHGEPQALGRDDRVVVATPRGTEIGVVLSEARPNLAKLVSPVPDGDILRAATDADEAAHFQQSASVESFVALAGELVGDLPLTIVDAEPLLDGTMIAHAVYWAECDATPFLDALSGRAGCRVLLLDLTRSAGEAIAESGCGKPGCGTDKGGCSTGGCSTGSCSKGAVKSPGELTEYFAGLRQQMEADVGRTPLV